MKTGEAPTVGSPGEVGRTTGLAAGATLRAETRRAGRATSSLSAIRLADPDAIRFAGPDAIRFADPMRIL
jgi:hypothetical protein